VRAQALYGQYVDRLRNLDYLEAELAQYHRAEQEQLEAAERRLRRMQRRMA
jgi:clusterin-associated protein 1